MVSPDIGSIPLPCHGKKDKITSTSLRAKPIRVLADKRQVFLAEFAGIRKEIQLTGKQAVKYKEPILRHKQRYWIKLYKISDHPAFFYNFPTPTYSTVSNWDPKIRNQETAVKDRPPSQEESPKKEPKVTKMGEEGVKVDGSFC